MRVGQLWSWIYVRGATSFEDMSDVSKELRATLARAYSLDRPEIAAEQVSVDGTRKWLLRLPIRGHEARAARDRDRLHPRGRPRHAVHLEPGRLHAHLLVLPHRHAAAGAQPRARGDRRPDPAGARPHRRLAGRGAARRTAASSPTRAQDHQRRADGHGRAALQFRQRARRDGDRLRRRRPRHVEAAHHALDQRRGAGDPALGRGGRHHARHLAARHARRAARQAGADQPQVSDCRADGRLPRLSRPLQRAPHHLRVRDAEGRQRQPRRRQGAREAARRHPRQDQPDPVQSLARHGARMLRLGADRALRRGREPGGLREPRAHAARPRHHGGLRPAQVGEPEARRARAQGRGQGPRARRERCCGRLGA